MPVVSLFGTGPSIPATFIFDRSQTPKGTHYTVTAVDMVSVFRSVSTKVWHTWLHLDVAYRQLIASPRKESGNAFERLGSASYLRIMVHCAASQQRNKNGFIEGMQDAYNSDAHRAILSDC
eukprot:4984546-Amphidinium_carterae.1